MSDWEFDDGDDDVALAAEPPARAAASPAEAAPEQAKKPDISPLEATIALARRGNKKILAILRRTLDEHPELWQHFGNLALQSQESWLQLIAGKDLYLAESLRRHLDEMRKEIAGAKPSPLDKLLVDRILACHIQVLYFEATETADPTGENMRVARYRMDRRDQAHRQFLSAVKMLAMVRNLVARTNVVQIELLHPMSPPTPVAPSVPVPNGKQTSNRTAPAERAPLFDSANRFKSNRMTGLMDSISVGGEG